MFGDIIFLVFFVYASVGIFMGLYLIVINKSESVGPWWKTTGWILFLLVAWPIIFMNPPEKQE